MHQEDKRNILIAAILTALILFAWPWIANHFFPPAQPPATRIEAGRQDAVTNAGAGPAPATPARLRNLSDALRQSPRIAIDTPKLKGTIALRGARIDDLVLPAYRQTVAKDSLPVRLFSPGGTRDAYYAGVGWSGDGVRAPGANTLWTADGKTLTPTSPVTLSWANGTGQTFRIRLSIDPDYMISAVQTVENRGAAPVTVRPFAFVTRRGHSTDPDTWTNHVGPIGVFNAAANYDVNFSTLDDGEQPKFETSGGWIGFTDYHWLAALVPDQKAQVTAEFRKGEGNLYQADFAARPVMVAPGKASATATRLFAGAKETRLLERYEDGFEGQPAIALFDHAIDWGWFYWFEKPIFYLLQWLFHAIGNYGLAIICLTFVVRGAMFPIAQRQFASMAQMRAVQPKMKALQEKHKDDKAQMQQEIMKLYKEEKVNPLAGCLPIFLQIPVFFALYKVLMLTIEMRHQPFVLWIKDLSAPDPLHILNLFGLLPFAVPQFLAIGPLAIVLGITMWLQFKLNPAPMDEMQKQVFALMPWMMMFVMAPFAAGLLLYWCTSNILTIAQQWYLYRQHPALKQAPAK